MADGSPASSMAGGALSSALDSNEVRAKQRNITRLSSPDLSLVNQGFPTVETSPKPSCTQSNVYPHRTKPIHTPNSKPSITNSFVPVDTYQFGLKTSDFSGSPSANTTVVGGLPSPNPAPTSPSKASPSYSRRLQEVFQIEGERLQREEKIASMVQTFEAELRKSGLSIDLSHLAKQLNLLQEGHDLPKSPSRYMEGDVIVVEDPPEPPRFMTESNNTQRTGKANWASLFKAQAPSKTLKLQHFPEMQQGKEAVVDLDESDIDSGSWNHCLIGYFLDGKMPYNLLCATARAVWKENAPISIKQIGSCFFFVFKDEETKMKVLEEGPYFFSRRYLVLTDWRRMLVPTTAHPTSIPAWVKLHKLPLECWTEAAFSRIASSIGRPIHVDHATATKRRMDYARVCVEISAGDELPSEVVVRSNGESVIIKVEYQWLPTKCAECKVFGHKCSSKPVDTPTELDLGSKITEAEISNKDPIVQCKVLEALAKGGSSALDVATKVIPSSSKVGKTQTSGEDVTIVVALKEDSSKLEGTIILGEGGLVPDPKPPSQMEGSSPPLSPSNSREMELDLKHGKDFKLVTNKKKNKGRSNQKAPTHSKGR